MPSNNNPKLRQSVRWQENYTSAALNLKLAGILPVGVHHGFVLKPGGEMRIRVEHDPDYPRSVAVVERDGYSMTITMDDAGDCVEIPALGTWYIVIEALYRPNQTGYQHIVAREQLESHHVLLGKVTTGEGINGNTRLEITQEMISADNENRKPAVTPDVTLQTLEGHIKQKFAHMPESELQELIVRIFRENAENILGGSEEHPGLISPGGSLEIVDGNLTIVNASTTTRGVVQLSSAVNSTSEALAATAKAVKTAYDKAVEASRIPTATATRAGIVELATTAEAASGTDNARAVTPAGLAAWGAVTGVPKGGIISFSGTFGGTDNRFPIPLGGTTPDTRWCLCDGVTTNGFAVPDLRDRMILGASASRPAGSVGGEESHEHSVSGTVGATTLDGNTLPNHTHSVLGHRYESTGGTTPAASPIMIENGGHRLNAWADPNPQNTGGSQPHTHSLAASTSTISSLPPYYALAFIMRIA